MASWVFKALFQKAVASMPAHRQIHFFLQRHVIRSLRIRPAFLEDRLDHCSKHLCAWRGLHPEGRPRRVLEIGTGWYPVVPVGLRLCGIQDIISVDTSPHLRQDLCTELLAALKALLAEGMLETFLPDVTSEGRRLLEKVPPRIQKEELLTELGITYQVEDARKLSFPSDSIDLIISNNTLEHIPKSIISAMLPELKRVLHPQGVMSHYIDLADHYSYGDSQISPYHFLRYSDKQWDWIENKIQSQNRMRASQYRQLFEGAGFEVIQEDNEWGDLRQLKEVPLAEPFKNMAMDDLGVLYSHMICRCA